MIRTLSSLIPTLVMDGEADLKDMEEYAASKAVAMHSSMTANAQACEKKSVAEWLEYLRSCQDLLTQPFS
ncbi:unnamed protein product [Dibothriocephalus latus]|uniref:Uncharacterized protein n=1 Tax=Dibothriocephalus latus TaxID=60516 RepID=A0A3P7LIS1_DIBLA|nr:unnamed protein product [Dibothriocephalus latus]